MDDQEIQPQTLPVNRRARARQSVRRAGSSAKAVGAATRAAAGKSARQAAHKIAKLPANLPRGVRDQIKQSAKRLTRVRSVKGAKAALIDEAERLFLAVTPLLAAAPLPLTGWRARVAAGSAGGAGAVVEQAEELAAVVSWGGAVPTAPVAAGAVITAWVLHLWIAVSARVNQLKAAGRQVDPELLGRELAAAYLGDSGPLRRDSMVRGVAIRAAEGWLAGLVPGVGIAFDAYAAQRTVARILRQPIGAHPLVPPGHARASRHRAPGRLEDPTRPVDWGDAERHRA